MLRSTLARIAAVLLLAASHFAEASEMPKYRFSPVNQYGINLTAAYWNPIISYVSQKSGVTLELKIGRTSADTTSYVLTQEVEFVFTNHLFSPEREKLGWKVFGRRRTPPVLSQIIVPADSPITTLAQLRGLQVGFAGPEALIVYKMPMAHLMASNIPVKTVFAGNMDAALTQLVNDKVAAAGSNSQLVEGFSRREGKSFRVLWSSGPLHDLALMAASTVPAKDVQAVSRAFREMAADQHGRAILAKASQLVGLPEDTSFIASDGSEYAAMRAFLASAPASLR